MAITPHVPVPAPEPRGLRYGLLTAAIGPLPLPEHGEGGGVTYEPVSCGQAYWYSTPCHGDLRLAKTLDEYVDGSDPDQVEAEPFVVYSSLVCGPVGNTSAGLEAKVRRRLANGEQTVAEFALWNLIVAGDTPLTSALATDPVAIVAELEQWLYGTVAYGNVGYLHASPRFASYATEAGLVIRDGPLLRTHMGTVWVFGGGYTDDGTVAITGNVAVWRATDVFVTPAGQVMDRTANQVSIVAEREYAVAFDCLAASTVFDWMPSS